MKGSAFVWTPEFILEKWKWDNQQNKQVREVHSSSEDLTLGSASSRTGQTVSRTSSVMFLSRTQEPGTPRVYLVYLFNHDHRDYWAFTVPLNTVHCKSLIKTTSPCEFSANHSSALAGQQMLMDRCPASWSTFDGCFRWWEASLSILWQHWSGLLPQAWSGPQRSSISLKCKRI